MRKDERFKSTGVFRRFLAALTALAVLCCLGPAAALAEQAPEQTGGMTVRNRREARVFHSGS